MLIILSVIVISSKKNFHIDEIFSYGLANFVRTGETLKDIGMQPKEGEIYKPSETAYLEYTAVQPKQQFNVRNVWYNQSQDTHLPLYYDNLTNVSDYLGRLKDFYNIINRELFGNCFSYLAVFFIILLCLICFNHNRGGVYS